MSSESFSYWTTQSANLEGMLGGYQLINEKDILYSKNIIKKYNKKTENNLVALDVGSGIGRVASKVLADYCYQMDLLECQNRFLLSAIQTIPAFKLGICYPVTLQDFKFEKKYDIIWIQWVLLYLNDRELELFLGNCCSSLIDNDGFVVVKENILPERKKDKKTRENNENHNDNMALKDQDYDPIDHSYIRSNEYMIEMFKKTGFVLLECYREIYLEEAPELYPQMSYVLKRLSCK